MRVVKVIKAINKNFSFATANDQVFYTINNHKYKAYDYLHLTIRNQSFQIAPCFLANWKRW